MAKKIHNPSVLIHRMQVQAGVTLIELLIVVAIIGILAAVAYPSYQQYVRQSSRAEAKGILLETAQFLERNYTTANRYDQDSAGAPTVLPFATSPKPGAGAVRYNINPNYGACANGQCFTLSAVPANPGPMAGDACGTLTLDHRGVQGAGGNVADCWQR